jgi:hypothetical protein
VLQDKVEKYAADVIAAYADSFVKEAIYGAATRITANDRLVKVGSGAVKAPSV